MEPCVCISCCRDDAPTPGSGAMMHRLLETATDCELLAGSSRLTMPSATDTQDAGKKGLDEVEEAPLRQDPSMNEDFQYQIVK